MSVDHNPIKSIEVGSCPSITKYWKQFSREVNTQEGYVRLAYYSNDSWDSGPLASITINADTKVLNKGKAYSESDAATVPASFTEVAGKTNATVTVSGKSTATKTTATVAAAPGAVTKLDFGGAKATKIKSSDKKIATVNSKGVVTFKKAGKVTITATTKRGNKKAKVNFTVSK